MTYKPPKGEDHGLDAQYKPIGISAVAAAAAALSPQAQQTQQGKSQVQHGDNKHKGQPS